MNREQIISTLIEHKRFHFPGGQPFACGASMRVFRNLGSECAGTTTPNKRKVINYRSSELNGLERKLVLDYFNKRPKLQL